jgi:serine protease Do
VPGGDPGCYNRVMTRSPTIGLGLILAVLLCAAAGAAPDDDLATVLELERRFGEVVDRVRPTVVAISASFRPTLRPKPAPETPRLDPVLPPPKEEEKSPEPRARGGAGSGVLVSADGLVLTNHHVAGWATDVRVTLSDGRRFTAEVVGTDPRGDLALLKIDAKDLPFAVLGPDDRPVAGSWVLAMGNPFTLAAQDGSPIVTQGIVSGLHRIQRGDARGDLFYGDAVQTDAEINPGNSGGPLFDLRGRLVGINGRIATRHRIYRINTGVGFAISARQIRRVLPNLKAGGTVRHGFLGIRYDVDERNRAGIEVSFVYPGSPAEAAGIRPGDRITGVEGLAIENGARLAGALSTYPEGARASLSFARRGQEREVRVVLARRPGWLSS